MAETMHQSLFPVLPGHSQSGSQASLLEPSSAEQNVGAKATLSCPVLLQGADLTSHTWTHGAWIPESLLGGQVSTDQETHVHLGEQEINFHQV